MPAATARPLGPARSPPRRAALARRGRVLRRRSAARGFPFAGRAHRERARCRLALLAALLRALRRVPRRRACRPPSTLREMQRQGPRAHARRCRFRAPRTTSDGSRASPPAAPLLAALFALPLLPWAPPGAVALWGVSLALEAALVAAAALFFAMTLAPARRRDRRDRRPLPARARHAPRSRRSPATPLAGRHAGPAGWRAAPSTPSRSCCRVLDAATRTDWLLYDAPPPASTARRLAALAVYVVAAHRCRACSTSTGATSELRRAPLPRSRAGSCCSLGVASPRSSPGSAALGAGAPRRRRAAAGALARSALRLAASARRRPRRALGCCISRHSTCQRALDYARLVAWLRALLELDPRSAISAVRRGARLCREPGSGAQRA